jgi:hypothetical protein
MNTSCSREQVNGCDRNKEALPDFSSSTSIDQPMKSKDIQTQTYTSAKTILKDLRDKRQNGTKSKFYVSELDYHIPDLNATHDSLDQGSVKSCGTDGFTVTTGTTVQMSNGITARLRRIFKRKNGKKNVKHENVPVSIAAMEIVDRDNTQANPVKLQKSSNDDNEDDIRDISQPRQKQKFMLSFFQDLFECCTTDEDLFLE